MAIRYIKVGHRYINANHIVKVAENDGKVAVVLIGMDGVDYYPISECNDLLKHVKLNS